MHFIKLHKFIDNLCIITAMNKQVSMNFAKVNIWHLAATIGIFCLIVGMLRIFGWSEPEVYPQIQKDIFLAINSLWSNVPSLAHNLTQLGDASVAFALLLVLFIAPKLWEALIASSLLSLVLSALFKTIYAMPRPARAFENTFNIIGERLAGTNSLPSGHSITIFTILSVLLFAFMPSTRKWRLPFIIGITLLGVFVGLSRVGVGAHYPLDVLVGASLGCVCGVFGVLVASKTRIFAWLDSHFGLLIFATLGAVAVVMAIQNISKYNLAVFYLALICALGCLFMILHKYFTSAQRLDLQCTIQPPPSQSIVFIFVISALQVAFFHFPFLGFVWVNLTLDSINAIVLFVSLVLFLFALTTLMPLLLALISFNLTKIWFAITSITNAIAVYFVSVYGVFLDKTMMGNLFNTNPAEAGEFLSLKMALFIIILGILPACFLLFEKVARPTRKSLAKSLGLIFFTLIVLAGVNFQNLLWFDKYSKQLGALIMPWSYIGNSVRYFQGELAKNKKEIPLPDARITNDKKSVVVLVIGESARAKNFSFYGYSRNTNPLLLEVSGLRHFYAKSSTTYTSASVKNMLSYKDSTNLYEILPNYLARTGVDVMWRSTNWGEPPLHLPSENIMRYSQLAEKYTHLDDSYESALVAGLIEDIELAKSPKVLIFIHTSTSHGPTYYKKYPPQFEVFKPVCKSVEPKGCLQSEIINAYDNTILYTDFLLHSVISQLSKLDKYDSTMIYVSDHGESLGENGVYMHGIPLAFAPKEQYEIPFFVWSSNASRIKDLNEATHFHIFHSVLTFLDVESEVLDEKMSIFTKEE